MLIVCLAAGGAISFLAKSALPRAEAAKTYLVKADYQIDLQRLWDKLDEIQADIKKILFHLHLESETKDAIERPEQLERQVPPEER